MKLDKLDPKTKEENLFLIRKTFIEAYLFKVSSMVTEDEMAGMPADDFEAAVEYFQGVLKDHDAIFNDVLTSFKQSMLEETQEYDAEISHVDS
jgi:hypothetical protein